MNKQNRLKKIWWITLWLRARRKYRVCLWRQWNTKPFSLDPSEPHFQPAKMNHGFSLNKNISKERETPLVEIQLWWDFWISINISEFCVNFTIQNYTTPTILGTKLVIGLRKSRHMYLPGHEQWLQWSYTKLCM